LSPRSSPSFSQRSAPEPTRAAHSRRWASWGAALGALVGLVTQAPAQWLAHGVAQLSHQRVLLTQAQGTVWQGSAQWVLSTGPRNGVPDATTDMALPTPVHWQIQPQFNRTTGVALGLRLSTDCCTLEPLTLSFLPLWGGLRVTIDDHQSQWPAHWLVGLGAPWNTIQPEGQMQLRTQGLSWQVQAGHAQLQGLAELQLQQLSTRLSTLRPLGSYRLQLRGGDTMAITLDTLEGSLQLQGNGQWLNQRLRFQGEASAAPEFEAALSNLLNILGQRRGAKSIMELS
jgi:general secretion pathway protein N